MRKKNIVFLCMVTVIAASLTAGGQQESAAGGAEASESGGSITVTDFLGREVTVAGPVEKVAFTHYATAETLKILDAWELAVARDGYTSDKLVYPNLEELPSLCDMLGSGYEPNMEKLFELDPDLLILEVIPMPGIEELIAKLDGIIPVVAIKSYDPEELFYSFDILGKLLGRETEAAAFTSWVKEQQQTLLDKTGDLSDSEKTRMFYKTSYGSAEELMTFSDDMSYVPARDRYSGAVNIAADLPSQGGWVPSLDSEWLALQDMEVLIIGDPQPGRYGALMTDTSSLAAFREKVMAMPVFADTTAVKTNRVYMLGDSFFGTPRHIIGFAYLAKWMHPDLFEELDPAVLNQEYFDRFLRLDTDVINGGLFVYPKE